MNDHRIGIGDIKSRLNNGGRNKDVDLTVDEVHHDVLELTFVHLAVRKGDLGFRYQLLYPGCPLGNVPHAVINIVDLSSPRELAADRLPDHLLVIFHDIGLDRDTLLGRLLEDRHIPDPDKAHVECPGDRCRGKREDVDVLPQVLYFLLVGNAEALLLVDD